MLSQIIEVSDCLEFLQSMAVNIDCVVTSPPYNIGIDYNEYSDSKSEEDYRKFINKLAKLLLHKLHDNGHVFLNMGSTNKDPWIASKVARIFSKYFTLQNDIVWVKAITIEGNSRGHIKPITSERYLSHAYEHIYHFTKSGNSKIDRLAVGVKFKFKSEIKRRKHGNAKRCAGNVWFIPYETVQSKSDKYNHPASFPLELPTRCLKLAGVTKDSVVFDPFLGSGTTLVAAKLLGVESLYGCDLDKKYVDISRNRLSDITGKTLFD